MAKAAKPKKERAKKYDQPLAFNGTFMDIIGASIEHAEKNTAKKVAEKKKKEE